jgi:hypothetical protein
MIHPRERVKKLPTMLIQISVQRGISALVLFFIEMKYWLNIIISIGRKFRTIGIGT